MSRSNPLFSVVVPARNRGPYLPTVLQTVLDEPLDDLEVLLLDNASTDDTREFAHSVSDERFRYLPSEQVLGMSENWERGLDHCRGDYVFYLGGDDGVLPKGLVNAREVIRRFNPPALSWQKPDYTWPDADPPNTLQLRLPGPTTWLDARLVLKLLCQGLTNYGLLPNIYSSLVKRTTIDGIRRQHGRFFSSVTPDVYSAISLAKEFQYFLFSPYPFSLSGGSAVSNGMSNVRPGGLDTFFAEAGLSMHSDMPVIAGSITSAVFEALVTANADRYSGKLRINRNRYFKSIVRELLERHPGVRSSGFATLRGLSLTPRERAYLDRMSPPLGVDSESVESPTSPQSEVRGPYELRNNFLLVRDCGVFGVHDVAGAGALVAELVGPYKAPLDPPRMTWASVGSDVVQRAVTRILGQGRASERQPFPIVDL